MRQRKIIRQVHVEKQDGFRQGGFGCIPKVVLLRVPAYEQNKPYILHRIQQPSVPQRSTFGPRRQIARFAPARITKTHRHQGKFFGIVKGGLVNAHPFTQIIAAFIVPGNSCFVDNSARCLSDNHNSAFAVCRNYWFGA
ncbi:hypothetical protein SDC9_111582 [bioreactor metagenome]|uniref:Uncharacterized protein n=1 Tax=bioreactor metagenome TaxID=1076179 RepID=A0A645BSD2_9ZZZZ